MRIGWMVGLIGMLLLAACAGSTPSAAPPPDAPASASAPGALPEKLELIEFYSPL